MSADITNTTNLHPGPDVSTPRRTSRVLLLTMALALGAAGMVVGMRIGASIKAAGSTGLALDASEKAVLLGCTIAALLLVLLVHELGHLLGGRLVGFRAFLLIVGPMRLERTGRGWSLHLNTDLSLFGGLAGSAATDARDLTRRTAIMVGAGPFVSLLLGVAAIIALLTLDLLPLHRTTPFSTVLLFFGLMVFGGTSTAIGLVTLVPLTTSGYLSDGARLLRLLRGGPVAERDSAIQALMGASLSGVRPRDLDQGLLAAAAALRDGSVFEFTAWQFAQMAEADRGNAEESLSRLRHMLEHLDRIPPSLLPGVHYDAARQFALSGHLAEARTQMSRAVGPVLAAPYLKPLAEATLLAAEGQRTEAAAMVPMLRRLLDQSIDRGGAQWLGDSLAFIASPHA